MRDRTEAGGAVKSLESPCFPDRRPSHSQVFFLRGFISGKVVKT